MCAAWDPPHQVENFSKDVEKLIKQTELEKKKRDELAYIDPEKVRHAPSATDLP